MSRYATQLKDKNGNIYDVKDLSLTAEVESLSTVVDGKASKAANAINGHIASLDANGNLTDSGYTIATSVPANAVFTDTTYSAATQSADGLMSSTDKAKLDGLESCTSLIEEVSGTTPSITGQPNVRYVCGEVSTISITPPSSGTIDVFFESGSTAAVLNVPNTVKFPAWFDTTELNVNTVYEIMITDGVYGSVMIWPS